MVLDTVELLATTFAVLRSLLVGLWPVVVLSPLRGWRAIRPSMFLFSWVLVAVCWAGGWFLPVTIQKPLFALIPAPWNGALFATVGAALLLWQVLARRHGHRRVGLPRQTGASPIEALFWEHAKPRIPELQREVPIGRYRVDFFVPSAQLAIELNGLAYHSEREQRIRDAAREREITRAGYRVITFLGPEVTRDVEGCVDEVLAAIAESHPITAHSQTPMARPPKTAPAKSGGLSLQQRWVLGGLVALFVLATVALAALVGAAFMALA